MKYLILLFILTARLVISQDIPAEKLIEKVKTNFDKVKDYEVDVHIKVDVDFMKVPEADAKILFKQPDKVKIKSEKFAMVPKEGLQFSPAALFKQNYSPVFVRKEKLGNYETSVLKIVPLEENSDMILSTIWVDNQDYIIRKIESSTKSRGSYSITLDYNISKIKYPLPTAMTFRFDVKKDNLPKNIPGEKDKQKETRKSGKPAKGSVIITYSNYQINKGIADNVFKEEKK